MEVLDKFFDVLTKNYLMDWQIPYIRQYLGGILESLNSHFVFVNRCTHVILIPVGPHKYLLWVIKLIRDLHLFPSSKEAFTSNFHIFFLSSLIFNLKFEQFPNQKFFRLGRKSRQHPQISNMT